MAETLKAALEELKVRVKALTTENRRLREENAELESQNRTLKELTSEAEQRRQRAELDAEYLAVSHKLADTPDTLINTRRHISQMIRNIDRCLEMLKE